MQLLSALPLLLALCSLLSPVHSYGRSSQPPGKNAILLSRVQTLTLRSNRLTTSRRVSPIPQMTCTGPSKRICDMYTIDTMRCTNEGYDYDEEDVQWTCTAELPPEFKLGSTDVVCEGYRDADDKWVLKGSCGVEYRLLLTERGEERFGKVRESYLPWGKQSSGMRKMMEVLGDLVLFGFMVACFVLILMPMFADCFGLRRNRGGQNGRRGWGGFGGGGGGDDNDGYPGPPPPYSSCADNDRFASRSSQQGWRPGFWTGALGGAAAGYGMGRRSQGGSTRRQSPFTGYGAGEGSSRSASSPRFSSTTLSTGFGSTRRR